MEGQGFVITDYAAGEARLSPVTVAMVEEQVGKLQPCQQFRIEPEPPIPAGEGLELMAVNCVRDPEDGGMMLVALLRAPGGSDPTSGYVQSISSAKGAEGNQKAPLTSAEKALQVISQMVETGEVPDFSRGWQPVQLSMATPEETRRMKSKERQTAALRDNKGGKKRNW